MFPKVRVQIPLDSTVFLLTLAVLENHDIFSSCVSEDDCEIVCLHNVMPRYCVDGRHCFISYSFRNSF